MTNDPSHPGRSDERDRIETEAANWLSRRDRGLSAEESAALLHWLEQDPRHREALEELSDVWGSMDALSALAPSPAMTSLDPELVATDRPRRTVRRVWLRVSVGVAAAACLTLWLGRFLLLPRTVETDVGVLLSHTLPDGSIAQLNTDSAIRAEFSDVERRIRLLRGEVFFTVTKDPARPFVVTSGAVAVRAVGTAFNVRQRGPEVEVLVAEGKVRIDPAARPSAPGTATREENAPVEPPLLGAGDRARIATAATGAAATTIEKVSESELQRTLAWQEHRLEFDATPLVEIAEEFNRYNRRQIVVSDEALAQRRFSGVFRADGHDALVALLEENFGVIAERSDETIVLRPGS